MLARYMEASREIPTATSFRTMTVTAMDARRKQLKNAGEKVSFTHLIAYAIARAATEEMPVMAHHFAEVDGKPHRVDDGAVNLGIAVDVEKKDGSRTLMVPVIRDAGRRTFPEFLDAFGNLIARTGSTPNDYLYAGEQFDPNIGFYYLRARYMNPSNGRFQTMDEFEGVRHDPLTLHKYLYANANPVDGTDPSGHWTVGGLAATMAIGGIINSMIGMIFSQHSPSSSEFWGEAAWNFGVGAVTAPVGGLATRLLAPLARATLGPLLQIVGRMGPIMLRGRGAVGQMLVRISRFFVNTNRSYPRVDSTGLGRLLQRAFPNIRWEHHHIYIQQSWSRVGGPNQIYQNVDANEGLRRIGNGLWNMIPIPRELNAALGRSELGTQLFATAYYSILVYGPAHTLAYFFDGED
ncbi:MAG TPA: RHS repeat-associated core domain-containing protein [Pyrinomonadaceae bacterium]